MSMKAMTCCNKLESAEEVEMLSDESRETVVSHDVEVK
jgi:hypothetical protein